MYNQKNPDAHNHILDALLKPTKRYTNLMHRIKKSYLVNRCTKQTNSGGGVVHRRWWCASAVWSAIMSSQGSLGHEKNGDFIAHHVDEIHQMLEMTVCFVEVGDNRNPRPLLCMRWGGGGEKQASSSIVCALGRETNEWTAEVLELVGNGFICVRRFHTAEDFT